MSKWPSFYDRARPSYPREVFDDLAALARLSETARLLEVGCGTGQATLPLAKRDEITCIELGEQLAAVARRNLAGFPNVEVINTKTASLLRKRGMLAVVSTKHEGRPRWAARS